MKGTDPLTDRPVRSSSQEPGDVSAAAASRRAAGACAAAALILLTPVFGTEAANADELTSPNYRHQAGRFVSVSAAGSGALTSSANPGDFGQTELTIGEAPFAAPVGSDGNLVTAWPGFWALLTGSLPSLDLDGDFAQFFLDPDDDGDGLEDVHETGTGIFVSATNTGTSRTRADSDGDGFDDGAEVQAGTDPNDPLSRPSAPGVPSLTFPLQLLLLALLLSLPGKWVAFGLRARQRIDRRARRRPE